MSVLWLDDFLNTAAKAQDGPTPYDEGYQAGWDDAQRVAEERIAKMRDEVAQTIADLSFTYAEAEAQVLGKVQPLFVGIAQKLIPMTGDTQFWIAVSDYLASVAAHDLRKGLSLALHPDMIETARSTLGAQVQDFEIHADPTLPRHAAWIAHDNQLTSLDTGRVSKVMQDALLALTDAGSGEQAHG